MIENKEKILNECNAACKNTLMETLEIEFVDVLENILVAKMPVNSRVHQPDALLHGGATVALAETVGSAAAFVFSGNADTKIRVIEIAANHVKSVKDGFVFATASVLHKGRTTQLWQVKVENEDKELVSVVKLTTISLYK